MNIYRKILVIGLTFLFVGASVIPSVLGDNYDCIERISNDYNQTNPSNKAEYLILWAGDATVTWQWSGKFDANASCPPSENIFYNLSEPSTLFIIILLNTSNDLRRDFLINRGGIYEFETKINERKYQTSSLYDNDFGEYHATMAHVYPVEINGNETLYINIQIVVTPSIGPFPIISKLEWNARDVIVNVQLP